MEGQKRSVRFVAAELVMPDIQCSKLRPTVTSRQQMMVVHPSAHGIMDSSHPHLVLTRLSEQRSCGLFCDVTIVVEDIKFHAHRNVLAATSGYFRNAFTASETCVSSQVVELPDLKSDVFASILNFIYSSKVESASTEDNKSLVAAGKRLGIPFLEKLQEIGKQEPEVFQTSANSESSANQPKLSGPCTLKKETPRLEEQDCSKGPRITNAFSITEVTSANQFTPVDLHSSGPQLQDVGHQPSGCPAPSMPALESDPLSEPTHALSEHSYAVSKGHETSDLKEGQQLCDKGGTKPVLIPSKTPSNHRLGPIKKRHKLCKGMMASISNETSAPDQNPVSSPGTQNTNPDPLSPLPSSDSATDHCSAPNLLPPPEVTFPQDADPPSLIPEEIPAHRCQQCPETFSNAALLNIHMQIHKRRFVSHLFCKYCQKKFMHLKRLRNHEQVCLKGPPELLLNSKEAPIGLDSDNTPGVDDTAFQIPDLRDPPMLTSPLETPQNAITKPGSGQRVYKCSVCKRAYVTLSSLKRHENVHSWQRAYPCHYCNKVFALAEYRTKHEIWHTGERRYQCIFCLETFMTYYILKNHQKSFHGIDPRLAANKKSANGGFKGSVYPIKLYRLLPMKFRKKRYKSYSQTYSDIMDNHEQSFTAPVDTNSPTAPVEGPVPAGDLDSVVSHQSLFSMPVTFMVTPKMVASEMPRITFDQPRDQNIDLPLTYDNMPCTQGGGLHSTDTHRKTGLPSFEGTGSPVFSYGYGASVTSQENTGSSMLMHGNNTSSTQNSSNTNRDAMPFLNIPPVCSFEGLSKLSELSAAAQTIEAMANQLLQPRPERTQNLSPGGKTETYIAKPACPGPSFNNQVLPLCQITVKIGNEAIIRRKIKGSKLFPKKKKRRCWKQVEDQSSPAEDGIGCPSLRLRAEVRTSVMDNEPCDDVNDPENDKPWRPYYTYKPKKKGKKLKSRQKRMKAVQYYTKPLSPEPDDDFADVDSLPEKHPPAENPESKRQLRSHIPREVFPCNSCGSSFSSPSSLSMHMVSCHQPRCKTCGKQCPFEELPNTDASLTGSGGDFVCQRCTEDGSCFSSDIAAHSLCSEKRYRCSYCPQRFLYLATKKSHEAKHLEKSSKGRNYRYSSKPCKPAALLNMNETKLCSQAAVFREPDSTEIKGNAKSYSPLSESKEMPKPESWGSPQTPKTMEASDSDAEGIYQKPPHVHKKTSLSFPYKSDRPFSPLLTEMHRRKSKKKHFLERSKDFGLDRHRQDSETQGQKGRLPSTATNNHLSTSRIFPACLTRVPVTKGASLHSPKSEWRLCKEEPFFHAHD
ncbi:zinc finger and BTB domain-containing protein 38 isoform X1 [Pygocentrus nattereri]|uniref:Zinc finger and BTB domain containing 38 n=2 Tax=Pygocentrus nattereri TaxID=42514 RepID=A0AAR2JU21_PYGNA|nr:zinc finger and BTB domain-containing protein 38 isoform X1 [Pygocentrus nattereri]XP_037395717.1 zinc finger and BTB domain-containing protein 38 isoform X1 [Pygocentrus nattereri]XP_037395718.1 zinc finger and BTB domain-containing protein 38 isoform X1 [Pygocentrus nattereri]